MKKYYYTRRIYLSSTRYWPDSLETVSHLTGIPVHKIFEQVKDHPNKISWTDLSHEVTFECQDDAGKIEELEKENKILKEKLEKK